MTELIPVEGKEIKTRVVFHTIYGMQRDDTLLLISTDCASCSPAESPLQREHRQRGVHARGGGCLSPLRKGLHRVLSGEMNCRSWESFSRARVSLDTAIEILRRLCIGYLECFHL